MGYIFIVVLIWNRPPLALTSQYVEENNVVLNSFRINNCELLFGMVAVWPVKWFNFLYLSFVIITFRWVMLYSKNILFLFQRLVFIQDLDKDFLAPHENMSTWNVCRLHIFPLRLSKNKLSVKHWNTILKRTIEWK